MFYRIIGKKYMDAKWKSCYDNSEKYPLFSGADKSSTIWKRIFYGKALSKEKYENHKKGIVSVVEERLYKQFPKLILSFNYFNTWNPVFIML